MRGTESRIAVSERRPHEFECGRCHARTLVDLGPMPNLRRLFDAFASWHGTEAPECAAEEDEFTGQDVTGRDEINGCQAEGDYGLAICALPVLHAGPHRYQAAGLRGHLSRPGRFILTVPRGEDTP